MRRILYKQPYTSLRSLSSINKQPIIKLKMSDNKGEEQRESHNFARLFPLGCEHCHLTGTFDTPSFIPYPTLPPLSFSAYFK
jgi:hypothetical protein